MSEHSQSFWDHLDEFRSTLIRIVLVIGGGALLALILYRPIFSLITHAAGTPLVLLGPLEGATLTLKVSFWVGFVFTAPLWGYLLFRFAAPGLKQQERRLAFPFFTLSFLFLVAGLAFALVLSLPVAYRFLYSFNTTLGENLWTVEKTVIFAVVFLLAHAFAFEVFVGLLFFVHFGVIPPEVMRKKRKYVVIGIFIAAAILTPPDVVTQCLLAGPLLVLYEVTILYGRVISRRRGRGRAVHTDPTPPATP